MEMAKKEKENMRTFGFLRAGVVFLVVSGALFLSIWAFHMQPDRLSVYHLLYDLISWNWKVTGEGMLLFALVPLAAVSALIGFAFLGVALATHALHVPRKAGLKAEGGKVRLVSREKKGKKEEVW